MGIYDGGNLGERKGKGGKGGNQSGAHLCGEWELFSLSHQFFFLCQKKKKK